jgi:hypothetical protein
MQTISERIIVSGDVYEHYIYERPVVRGFKRDPPIVYHEVPEVPDGDDREKSLRRARREVRRLINSNVNRYYDSRDRPIRPKFLSITFKENVTDLEQANYEWKKFRQRLEYELKQRLKYLVVVEFQKRGAVHYHATLFNTPYLPRGMLAEKWGQGYVKINAISKVDNIGAYVSKYMQKEFDDERLRGEKCYFTSRGLYQPWEITEKNLINSVLESLPGTSKVYETIMQTGYSGFVQYTQYNTNKVNLKQKNLIIA